jgi:surfeit locus 1 family protein
MYRFLWRPRWIALHLLVITAVVVMVNLGLWQLRRLDERKDYNATVESAQQLPAVPITELVPAGAGATEVEVDAVVYRQVTMRGVYAEDEQVLVRNRSYNGAPGYWVITPLVLDDGDAVAVNRGWVPFNTTNVDGPWDEFAPPPGPVSVDGMVRESQVRSGGLVGGPTDPEVGELATLSRVDVGRLAQQSQHDLYPFYVDLRSQQPAQGDLPAILPEPDLGEGNHLSYAGQWFIFAGLLAIIYPLWIRRAARHRSDEPSRDDDALEPTLDRPEPVASGS